MIYLGDFTLGDTFDFKFNTTDAADGPITLAGSPVVMAYPGNSTTEISTGITLTVDFDGRTGMHNVRVVASTGNGYAVSTNYALVITTGTVDGISVVGRVLAHFSIQNRASGGGASDPWATALPGAYASGTAGNIVGNRLDAAVSSRLAAASYTAPDNASITTILGDTNDIQTRLPAALVGGRMDVSVGAMAANVLTATAIATDALTAAKLASDAVAEIQAGLATLAAIAALNNLSSAQVRSEVQGALATDTYAEPGAVPAATASLAAKIGWLQARARNKLTQTATQQKVRNDGDTVDIGAATVSDDGTTFTRGKFA